MAIITLRSIKGSPLTIEETDANFSNLNTEVGTKLDATSYNAADILVKLKTVDTDTSGLNANFLQGLLPLSTNTASSVVARDSSGNFSAGTITANLTGNTSGVHTGNVTGNVTGNLTGLADNSLALGGFAANLYLLASTASSTYLTQSNASSTYATITSNNLKAAADQTFYLGTTQVAINRTTGALTLNGVSIDGSAGSVAWTNVTDRPTNVSSFTNDSGYVTSSVGVGQTWQNVTSSRAIGVTYTNSTGKPIMVSITVGSTSASGGAFNLFIDGVNVASQGAVQNASIATIPNITIIIPNGSTYSITNVVSGSAAIALSKWFELR